MRREIKKYRLGSQSEEYELREDYLGWTPKNEDWMNLCSRFAKNEDLTIVNPDGKSEKTVFLHQIVIKDAFPLSFFREKRAENWNHFAIVSKNKISEKFIIPLH